MPRLRPETPRGQRLTDIRSIVHLDAGLVVEVEEMLDTASATPILGGT